MREIKVMKKTNPNIEVSFQGVIYKVRKSALREYTWGENEGKKYLSIGPTEAGQMTKQFVKNLNKNYLCKVKASWFSGGNSLDVYVTNQDGSEIPTEDYNTIKDFVQLWKYGKFNGMIDMYEHEDANYKTDTGNDLEGNCKYVMVNNRPQFGTVEWVVNEVKNVGRTLEDTTQYVSNKKIVERAVAQL